MTLGWALLLARLEFETSIVSGPISGRASVSRQRQTDRRPPWLDHQLSDLIGKPAQALAMPKIPRHRHCIARSSPPMPGIKRVAVVANDGLYFPGSQLTPEYLHTPSMVLRGNQYYLVCVARLCHLSNAANLLRSVAYRLRKYPDSSRWDADLLKNLFAINVLWCPGNTKAS